MSYQSHHGLVCDSKLPSTTNTSPDSAASGHGVDLEACLSAFVRSTLAYSCSGQTPAHVSMEILDKAWKAQKTLWQLRLQNP